MKSLMHILKHPLTQTGILFFTSALLVLIFHEKIPEYMTFDEVEFAKLALQLDNKPYTPYSTYATGHATLYFYLLLFSMKIFGITKFALRLPAAIFGILSPVVFFFILKFIYARFNKRTHTFIMFLPFIASLIFISTRWYINFARFGFEATFLLFLELLSLFYMVVFVRSSKLYSIILSGFYAGLAYNSYQPGRVFVFIPFFLLAHHLITMFRKKTIGIWNIFVLVFCYLSPFVILALPLTVYLIQHPDIRMYQLFYPDNHEMTLAGKWNFFVENVGKTIAMFFSQGDMNGRHNYTGKPALNPFMGLLFIFGLFQNFKQRNNPYNHLFIAWFIISLVPTLLTYPWENPNMLRTFTVIPPLIYFSTVAISSCIDFIQKITLKATLKKVVLVLFGTCIFLSIVYELRTYFYYQRLVFSESFEAKKELRYYINHPNKSVFEK